MSGEGALGPTQHFIDVKTSPAVKLDGSGAPSAWFGGGVETGANRLHFRGRCFAEIDRIINLPRPFVTRGGSA